MPQPVPVPADAAHQRSDDVVVEKPADVPLADLTEWKQVVSRIATCSKTCTIALVGKYVKLHDAHLSVMESCTTQASENDSQGGDQAVWKARTRLTRTPARRFLVTLFASSCPAASATRYRGYASRPPSTPAREQCALTLASAWACDHGDGVAWVPRADAKFQRVHPRTASTTSSPLWPTSRQHPQGRHHASGQVPCTVAPGTKMAEATAKRRSGSVTATATSSTTTSGRRCRTPVWLPAPAPTAVWWRRWSCPAAPSIWVPSSTGVQERPNRAHPPFSGVTAAALVPHQCPAQPGCTCKPVINEPVREFFALAFSPLFHDFRLLFR